MRAKVCAAFLGVILGASLRTAAQNDRDRWIDSVFATLDQREKIGQLFFLSVSGTGGAEQIIEWQSAVKSYRPGGIHFTEGYPENLVRINRILQNLSGVPLLASVDIQRGFTSVADSLVQAPSCLLLSSQRSDSLTYELAREVGRQFNLMGVHLALGLKARAASDTSPYAEALSTFGGDEAACLNQADLVIAGLSSRKVFTGILFPASLYPNQPRSGVVSVGTLPPVDSAVLEHQNIFRLGASAVYLPWSNQPGVTLPAESRLFVNPLLRNRLGFEGMLIGDARGFKAPAGKITRGAAEDLAFYAGLDVILSPENLQEAIRMIQRRIKKEPRLQDQLNQSVRRILGAKYDAGLNTHTRLHPEHVLDRLNSATARILREDVYQGSVTVLANKVSALPVRTVDNRKLVSLAVGRAKENEFNRNLRKHADFELLEMNTLRDTSWLYAELDRPDLLVVSVYPHAPDSLKRFLLRLAVVDQRTEVIVVHFGDPRKLAGYPSFNTLIAAYTDEDESLAAAGQVVMGALKGEGLLPLPIASTYEQGLGLHTPPLNRLSYSQPEKEGLDSRMLEEGISRVAWEAINSAATPGCHVLVARRGKVVFERSYGWQTYSRRIPVTEETIYDLASVTKISATLQAIMFLYERGLIDLHKKASVYLPELRESNKKDITIKDILTHQAGLWPFLPFWSQTMADSVWLPQFYNPEGSDDYSLPVSQGLFANNSMKDSLWHWIVKARIREKPNRTPYDYRYSDMGFYILQHLAETLLNQPMEEFLAQNLYEPLGAVTTGFLPLRRFSDVRIAPTEDDKMFRKSLLTGYVHDQGAAMHGGIAGHAGLFSSAMDLAKLGQMWLNNGTYGGIRYFRPATIELFTQKQFSDSRRGLGWDKPPLSDWTGPTSLLSSPMTFGHTGFTGTCIWVDPEFELVYVFLSNRVHPDMNNNKLLAANIRSRIQDAVYESIFSFCRYALR
jgi:CubicO group peptidase (beta-lactamase class C family)/beta-glucosidase-like glycosyl hydrolase